MVGAATGESSGSNEPLQIPPTRAPRRRRRWPRWWKITAAVVFVAVAILASTALVNHEVGKRFATVLPSTTTTVLPTTTTAVESPQAPRGDGPRRAESNQIAAATPTTTTTTTMVVSQEVPKSAYDIITKLDALPVKDEHTFGYGRGRYGAWRDDDKDGCTTPFDVWIDQGTGVVSRRNPCDIVSGEWHSLYDNVIISDFDQMTIDHVVGLYEAWKSGAFEWTDAQRNNYLNSVKNATAILAVSRGSQQTKAGRDPKDWLPPYEEFRCRYLQTWVDIKTVWKLSVDAGEREAIAAAALNC